MKQPRGVAELAAFDIVLKLETARAFPSPRGGRRPWSRAGRDADSTGWDAMAAGSDSFLASLLARFGQARDLFAQASGLLGRATFRIKHGTPAETVAELDTKWKLDEEQKRTLLDLGATKTGAAFIDEKVEDMNRGAFHRSAFALNAFTHLGFVDLPAQFYLSFPQLKLIFVLANLVLAGVAHASIRQQFRALLAGPSALPPKRIFWGLFANPDYNRAVKASSRPYARSAWTERSLYRPAYFLNAASIFLGSQFIVSPEKLFFPLGFIAGKLSGVFSTLVMLFDVWRGFRAGEDARAAREREIAVYRDLDI